MINGGLWARGLYKVPRPRDADRCHSRAEPRPTVTRVTGVKTASKQGVCVYKRIVAIRSAILWLIDILRFGPHERGQGFRRFPGSTIEPSRERRNVGLLDKRVRLSLGPGQSIIPAVATNEFNK